MQEFKDILDEFYNYEKEMVDEHDYPKLEFIGSVVFDMDTYDGEMDIHFAKKMIEVLQIIINKENFEYIKNKDNYLNYLTMVNMPFLKDKLEYGTSIRGAWLDEYKEYEILWGNHKIEEGNLINFINQLIEWSNK